MSQPGGKVGHRGILIRGSNGDLWFMRDDYPDPVRVDPALTNQINQALGAQSKWLNPPLAPVITILDPTYGPLIQPDGVIHHCAT
jgi:hypothetical protein